MQYWHISVLVALVLFEIVDAGVYNLPIKTSTWAFFWWKPSTTSSSQFGGPQPSSERTRFLADQVSRAPDAHFLRSEDHPDYHHSKDISIYLIGAVNWYTVPMSIGTPPFTTMRALLDTSWSTIFIPSVECSITPDDPNHCWRQPLFDSSLSSTYATDGTPAQLDYSNGDWSIHTSGRIANESIWIGCMELENQTFEETASWRPSSWFSGADGVFDTALGLSLSPNNLDEQHNMTALKTKSPFMTMVEQGQLDHNVVSISLGRNRLRTGYLTLGGLPQGIGRDDLTEVPLSDRDLNGEGGFWSYYATSGWQVRVKHMSMSLGNISTPISNIEYTAVIATSYAFIGLSQEMFDRIQNVTGLSHLEETPCEIRNELHDWTLDFGYSKTLTLTPFDYFVEYPFAGELYCVPMFKSLENAVDVNMIILGSPFLNGLHTVLDVDRRTIGFANRLYEG